MKNNVNWDQPEDFIPERFLRNGIFDSTKENFVPFGVGIRKCPGDKYAWINLFLLLIKLIQKTDRLDIKLKSNQVDIYEIDESSTFLPRPKKYFISLNNCERQNK